MEHPFFINGTANRSESMRWLTIAEKLLSNRDLFGSKSFATRVRDSDPNSVPADQILAIVDTLIAGDKRINNQHLDWYAILQIPPNQTHDSELIANQYRRLALVLNPQKNNFPFADQAFRLVVDAWSVLSNPLRKSFYDKELGFFVNLASPTSSNNVSFMQSNEFSSIPVMNRGQSFVSHEHEPITNTNISFGRDRAAPPVNFLSGDTPQGPQAVTFLSNSSRDQQQPVTFSIPEQMQPVNAVPSSINFEQQPATFVSRDQPQSLNFLRSSNSEQQQFSFGSSSTIGQQRQQPVASVEQQGHERRDEDLVGNNQNQSAGISNNASNVKEKKGKVDVPSSTIPSFWTACPYCYLMYEYPLDYEDCTLRCQNCKRAFQAVNIPSPPPIVDGKEAYFCCWGFMPLGFSVEIFERNRADVSSWSPFSPMFTCPQTGGENGGSNVNNPVRGQSSANNFGSSNSAGGPGSGGGRKHSAPRTYNNDDDDGDYLEISESSEQSDEDWNGDKKRKKGKSRKVKSARTGTGTPSENAKKQQAEKGKNVKGDTDTNMQDGLATQAGVEMPNVGAAEPSKRGVASKTRRQSGSVAKHFGKLDLNVEFSNEVEAPAPGRGQEYDAGTEEDDNVEVIGFFEGLDEFLSGLHIVNAVGDDGVRAA